MLRGLLERFYATGVSSIGWNSCFFFVVFFLVNISFIHVLQWVPGCLGGFHGYL